MKIFFVGMHNKPGKTALDPTTRTGKIINFIISESGFPPEYFRKTNLCNCESMPPVIDMPFHMKTFLERTHPSTGDVFILLGNWVQTYFRAPIGTTVIRVAHPSSFIGRHHRDLYITDVLAKLWHITKPILAK